MTKILDPVSAPKDHPIFKQGLRIFGADSPPSNSGAQMSTGGTKAPKKPKTPTK